ncbi:hypothetical protein GIB67_007703 [Kingdonia uniflora]|uniref:NB-ARC domain-containing protein n=1 Tax=Kingdonia uniflora TaxID=39325 RepID=A0A7J7N212_9MAGN|nr:hypothetical protein GIB67_007703 [Kingdonia uniflora]
MLIVSSFMIDYLYAMRITEKDKLRRGDVFRTFHLLRPDIKNGSRIVITTRIVEVALQVDPGSPPHELKSLTDDDSWDLFTKKVIIAHDNTPSSEKCSFPMQLEELGRKIVKTCGGLSLAIVLLGGLLIGKFEDYKTWSILLEIIYWQLSQDLTPCTKILALSYNDLPSYLKPCFLYLGIYPEDYEIFAQRLIRMWIAEGFIVQRNEIVEDIGEEYLEELAGLRPILPKSLGKLVHLRYLRLRNLDVSNLPTIIRNLRNLQILDLRYVSATINRHIKADSLSNLHQLRYLRGVAFNPPNDEGSTSRNLQTLNVLKLKQWSRVKDGWDKCTNLKKLGLVGDLHLHEEDISIWISNLDKLECLSLEKWPSKPEEDRLKNPIERFSIFSKNLYKLCLGGVYIEKLPEPCDFPHNFSSFTLVRSTIRGDIISTFGKLPTLVDLCMYDCSLHSKEMIFSHGGFPKLQVLGLWSFEDLEEMHVEERSLRSLKVLFINECRNLKMLPDGLRHVTTLQRLALKNMPKEFNGRVDKGGEDWEKVAHVPTIITL